MLSDIILRRAEASCGDNHIGATHRTVERVDYGLLGISRRDLLMDGDTYAVEVARKRCAIRIDNLSDKYLVTYGNYRCFHHLLLLFIALGLLRLG